MATTAGLLIAALSGAAIAVIGLLYLVYPVAIAASFGLPSLPNVDATAWLRVKGVRDVVTGVVAAVLLVMASPATVGWVLLAFTLIPIGDAATVLAARGQASAAWGIHGTTALTMVVGALLLVLGS